MKNEHGPTFSKALEISPLTWWKAFEWSITITEGFAKALTPQLDFRDWISKGIVTHHDVTFEDLTFDVHSNEIYKKARTNTYYHKVGGISQFGHEVLADTVDELTTRYQIKEGTLFFQFRVSDLLHFSFVFFQHWHAFDEFYAWVRWQTYFEFIKSKLQKPHAQLFEYMMMGVLSELDRYENTFLSITQYKTFRDKLEEMERSVKPMLEEYAKLRDANQNESDEK